MSQNKFFHYILILSGISYSNWKLTSTLLWEEVQDGDDKKKKKRKDHRWTSEFFSSEHQLALW
jgi:hypothetical protein